MKLAKSAVQTLEVLLQRTLLRSNTGFFFFEWHECIKASLVVQDDVYSGLSLPKGQKVCVCVVGDCELTYEGRHQTIHQHSPMRAITKQSINILTLLESVMESSRIILIEKPEHA